MTAEAVLLVTAAAALQRWVPMRRWSALLGRPGPVPDAWRGAVVDSIDTRAASPSERRVAAAVRRAARRLPWQPSCLAQATAGQIMLRHRGESGVVVIGLQPEAEAAGPNGQLWPAHAWLLGRAGALTGAAAASGFTPTTVFSPHRSGRPAPGPR